jgi:3-dehydroquinate synthase
MNWKSMNMLEVSLGERKYPIHIGSGMLRRIDLIEPRIASTRVAIVTDETVARLYLEELAALLARYRPVRIVLPDGEQHKTLDGMKRIFDGLITERCDRSTTLLALGGGVVGDMAGFAAACYQRGVPFIQLPTTLLAQVDSSVGGKTGVNHPMGKNMIGAFYQPRAVLIDTDTLNSLPDRELSAGIAEIIKYGLICDTDFLIWLEANMEKLVQRDSQALAFAIERSCRHKAEVVAADETESGVRATLNFGHTFGHAIEAGAGYGTWLHGEAISAGMVLASELSHRLGWLNEHEITRIKNLLARAKLPVKPPVTIATEKFLKLMAVDKKVQDGKLRLVLLRGIGNATVTSDFPPLALHETLRRALATP